MKFCLSLFHFFKNYSSLHFYLFYKQLLLRSFTAISFNALLFLTSCNESDIVGVDVQPTTNKITVGYDTSISVITLSVKEDSLSSDETFLNLLGSYKEQTFGLSTSSITTQCLLSSNNVNFGSDLILDSIVLSLVYNGFYGDTAYEQTVKVYELSEDIYKDSTYYSNRIFSYNTTELASYDFYPNPTDSVIINSQNNAPQLRIRLSNSIGQKFLDASGSSSLVDDASFLSFFKGFYITPANISQNFDAGAILYFDLESPQSKLTLYYKNSSDTALSFDFLINDKCARVNNFTHDYTGTDIDIQLTNKDTINGYTKVYTQAMAGVKTKILLPDILKFVKAKEAAINKAQIIIKLQSNSFEKYTQPFKMLLLRVDSSGKNDFLLDQFESHYDGNYYSSDNTYQFNITRHIQSILQGTPDYGLYFLPYGTVTSASRAIFEGNNNIKLQITYSQIN